MRRDQRTVVDTKTCFEIGNHHSIKCTFLAACSLSKLHFIKIHSSQEQQGQMILLMITLTKSVKLDTKLLCRDQEPGRLLSPLSW